MRQITTKRFLPLAALGLLAAAPALLPERGSPALRAEAGPLPVVVGALRAEPGFTFQRSFTGRVEAGRRSELGFEVPGRLLALASDEGDRVEAGQVLARLDSRKVRARKAELEARLEAARSLLSELVSGPRKETLAAARARVEALRQELSDLEQKQGRSKRGLGLKVTPKAEHDELSFARKAGGARLEAAERELEELSSGTRKERIEAQRAVVRSFEARLRILEIELSDHDLRAPFTGILSHGYQDEGTRVEAGDPVFEIVQEGHLKVRIGITVKLARSLEPGMDLEVRIGGKRHRARLRSFSPVVDFETRTVPILLDLDPRAPVRPGELARLSLEDRREEKGFWLPTTALVKTHRGLWSCFVLAAPEGAEQGLVESRLVEILHSEEDRVYARGTLRDGDRVLLSGIHRVAVGQEVIALHDREEASR